MCYNAVYGVVTTDTNTGRLVKKARGVRVGLVSSCDEESAGCTRCVAAVVADALAMSKTCIGRLCDYCNGAIAVRTVEDVGTVVSVAYGCMCEDSH